MKRKVLPICLMICLLADIFSAWKLYGYYRIYRDGKKEYDKLTDYIEKMNLMTRKMTIPTRKETRKQNAR